MYEDSYRMYCCHVRSRCEPCHVVSDGDDTPNPTQLQPLMQDGLGWAAHSSADFYPHEPAIIDL